MTNVAWKKTLKKLQASIEKEKQKRLRAQLNSADLHSGCGKRDKLVTCIEERYTESNKYFRKS